MADERISDSLLAFRALLAAINARRLYPAGHPALAKAVAGVAEHLASALETAPEWRVAVVGSKLTVGGETIDDGSEGSGSLAEALQPFGADTIIFRRGVRTAEVRALIDILGRGSHERRERSLSTRLAEAGVVSIEAGRLCFDDAGEANTREALRTEVTDDVREVYDHAVGFIHETLEAVREGRKISVQEAESLVQSIVRQMQEDRSPYLILTTLKSHHPYTFTHIINVCILTLLQLEALGATDLMLRNFGLAAMLHDIGKSAVPAEILSKPGKLTSEEFAQIQRHPQEGVHILHHTRGVPDLAMIVAFEHHMRYNQEGYPRLRRPRPLHLCSLMTNISDTYDAMRTRRSYQSEQPPERVANLIADRAGKDFHPQLARAFLQLMGAYPPGTRVRLDSGEEGVVIRANPQDPFRPMLLLVTNERREPVARAEVVDLLKRDSTGNRYERNIFGSIASPRRGAGDSAAET